MDTRTAYRHLADWFEYLNDDRDYENWSQYLISQLKKFPVKKGVDIGCGSGWFTRAFVQAGYEMTGVDVSAEMLTKAEELSLRTGKRAEFLLGDITKFSSPKKFGFATAVNDCFNYVPKDKLLTAFKKVYGLLEKNGVFLFDVSSERKFREKIANTVSVDDRDGVTYLSFNAVQGDTATMEVTLFVRQQDGKYERKDEKHVQYIYSAEEIIAALEKAGFTLLQKNGHLGEDENVSDRIFFVAQKGEKND